MPAGVAAPTHVSVLASAWLCGDDAVARQQVALHTPFGWPDHPLAVDAEDHVADVMHAIGIAPGTVWWSSASNSAWMTTKRDALRAEGLGPDDPNGHSDQAGPV